MNFHNEVCIVTVSRKSEDDRRKAGDKPSSTSSSGIRMGNNYIISHASVLHPLLEKDTPLVQHLGSAGSLRGNVLGDFEVNVLVEPAANKYYNNGQHNESINARYTNASEAVVPCQPRYSSYQASVVCMWNAKRFQQAIDTLMPSSDGWAFSDENEKVQPHAECDDEEKEFNIHKTEKLLPQFLLLRIQNCSLVENTKSSLIGRNTLLSDKLGKGDPVYVVGTPFGDLTPAVFMNSISKGIVSNTAGDDGCLILTDARCIPGSEGGAVYRCEENGQLGSIQGMVVAPLCWKNNEWIGLALVCRLSEVINSLLNAYQFDDELFQGLPNANWHSVMGSPMCLVQSGVLNSVVMVKSANSWGSGIYIDPQAGFIVTCSHVVKNALNKKVSVSVPGHGWTHGSIIYETPLGSVYDVAILKVYAKHDRTVAPSLKLHVDQGADVYSVGHALFNGSWHKAPSISKGVISKVVYASGKVVMIQTSCAVHGGDSGGALVTTDGRIVGMITCNAKDSTSGASYPHINMSVPISIIRTTLTQYKLTNDLKAFESLHNRCLTVKNMWSLRSNSSTGTEIKSLL